MTKIIHGDCLEAMKLLEADSIDTIITDPPYGLLFMGKGWDHGVPDKRYWTECLRVAKPGAMMLVFGGTRTYHRLACAIEDSGWEVRDSLMWLYGSGFPKSLNISKAIDKAAGAERRVVSEGKPVKRMIPGADQNRTGSWIKDNGREYVPAISVPASDLAKSWNGWGTALKPAYEPIILAMKPLDGTYAQNAQKWGVAGLNIDGCRIIGNNGRPHHDELSQENHCAERGSTSRAVKSGLRGGDPPGRWPANAILDSEACVLLDEQTGTLHSGKAGREGHKRKAAPGEGIYGGGKGLWKGPGPPGRLYGDSGGASRFFYCTKASRKERGEGNDHPTVMPLALMRYLVRLTRTPSGGVVLDPFAGSGTTGLACRHEGRDCILIEKDEHYCEIIRERLRACR